MTHVVAFLINAVSFDNCEIVFAIAEQNANAEWQTALGETIHPFYTAPFEKPAVTIPEGWIEHLHTLAAQQAARQPKQATAPSGLAALLAKRKSLNIERRGR